MCSRERESTSLCAMVGEGDIMSLGVCVCWKEIMCEREIMCVRDNVC